MTDPSNAEGGSPEVLPGAVDCATDDQGGLGGDGAAQARLVAVDVVGGAGAGPGTSSGSTRHSGSARYSRWPGPGPMPREVNRATRTRDHAIANTVGGGSPAAGADATGTASSPGDDGVAGTEPNGQFRAGDESSGTSTGTDPADIPTPDAGAENASTSVTWATRVPAQDGPRRTMPPSAARTAANRRNARKGGPNTREGKERISRNATTDGLWAKSIYAIRGGPMRESEEEVLGLVDSVVASLLPRNAFETSLAHGIALADLQLWRAVRRDGTLREAAGWAPDTVPFLEQVDRLGRELSELVALLVWLAAQGDLDHEVLLLNVWPGALIENRGEWEACASQPNYAFLVTCLARWRPQSTPVARKSSIADSEAEFRYLIAESFPSFASALSAVSQAVRSTVVMSQKMQGEVARLGIGYEERLTQVNDRRFEVLLRSKERQIATYFVIRSKPIISDWDIE